MHRVELKARLLFIFSIVKFVPNAPCGVESQAFCCLSEERKVFLMHRVELKAATWRGFSLAIQRS